MQSIPTKIKCLWASACCQAEHPHRAPCSLKAPAGRLGLTSSMPKLHHQPCIMHQAACSCSRSQDQYAAQISASIPTTSGSMQLQLHRLCTAQGRPKLHQPPPFTNFSSANTQGTKLHQDQLSVTSLAATNNLLYRMQLVATSSAAISNPLCKMQLSSTSSAAISNLLCSYQQHPPAARQAACNLPEDPAPNTCPAAHTCGHPHCTGAEHS